MGIVTVGGLPVACLSPDRGMLFQTPMLFGWLTTRNNVLFGPRAQRAAGRHERDDPELEAEAAALLDRVGLGGFGEAFPHELSGGMQHRAAFARALASRPSVLLMDEPFGALDAITRERMHEFLLDMWEQHRTTIIFVTHDLDEAILLGDRVAVMGGLGARHRRDHRHPAAPAAARPRHRHRGLPERQTANPRRIEELSRCPVETLPVDDQVVTEPAGDADLALATDQDERADLAAYKRARRRARTVRLATGALGLVVLAVLWQLAAMLINDPVFLPSVSQTAASFAHYFGLLYPAQGQPLWYDALTSLRRILIGFTAGTVAAWPRAPGCPPAASSGTRSTRGSSRCSGRCPRSPSSRCSSSGSASANCPRRS